MKRQYLITLFFSFLLIAVVLVSVAMFKRALFYDLGCDWTGDYLRGIAIEGEYSEEGSDWKPLTKETKFDYVALRDITVQGHFTSDLPKGTKLFLKIDQLRVSLRVNGELLFDFKPIDGDGNPTQAIGKLWYTFVSPGISTEEEVELNFGNLYRDAYFIQFDELLWNMRTGNERLLLFEAMKDDAHLLVIGAVFLFLTLFLFIIALFCGVLRINRAQQFLWLGLTTLFSAFWFCTLAPSLSLLWPWPVFFNILYSYSIQGIAIFVTLFMVSNVSGWRKEVLFFCIAVLMGTLIIDMFRQISGAQDLFDAIRYFSILDIIVASIIIVCLHYEIRARKSKELRNLLKAMLPLVGFGVLELVNGYIQFSEAAIYFGIGLISFAVLEGLFLLLRIKSSMESEKRALILENELTQSQISIMLSQIQPHFLYNSLASIKSLCNKNPQQAREAIVYFSNYLRGNMDSLVTDEMIPFERELSHIETYLALEKMRFGNDLQVIYDLSCCEFFLPVLTVQPIVENAVRYGVGKKEEGGTVTIGTRETKMEIIITIKDDGVGFDSNKKEQDGHIHIGIDNVKKRLKAQCGGILTVESTCGMGTIATITMPKGEIEK